MKTIDIEFDAVTGRETQAFNDANQARGFFIAMDLADKHPTVKGERAGELSDLTDPAKVEMFP